jgi:hypothetical protein
MMIMVFLAQGNHAQRSGTFPLPLQLIPVSQQWFKDGGGAQPLPPCKISGCKQPFSPMEKEWDIDVGRAHASLRTIIQT